MKNISKFCIWTGALLFIVWGVCYGAKSLLVDTGSRIIVSIWAVGWLFLLYKFVLPIYTSKIAEVLAAPRKGIYTGIICSKTIVEPGVLVVSVLYMDMAIRAVRCNVITKEDYFKEFIVGAFCQVNVKSSNKNDIWIVKGSVSLDPEYAEEDIKNILKGIAGDTR